MNEGNQKPASGGFKGLLATLFGSVALGIFSTFGDWVWAAYIPQHKMIWGMLHGIILCLFLGLVLGLAAGGKEALKTGLWGTPVIGFLAAGFFYLGSYINGYAAMFGAWMALWVMTGLLFAFMVDSTRKDGLVRGLIAAVASGLAFYAISGIWTNPPPDGPNYPWNLVAWTLAFLPGLGPVLIRR